MVNNLKTKKMATTSNHTNPNRAAKKCAFNDIKQSCKGETYLYLIDKEKKSLPFSMREQLVTLSTPTIQNY